MRSHICVHRATTKYFSNSFVFKTEIEKEGLPGDITPALGAGGPRFKSGRPDQNHLPCLLQLIESAVHRKTHLWNSVRQEVWIRNSFSFREFATRRICKNKRSRSAIQKLLNGRNLKKANGVGEGKTGGTSRTFRSSFWSKTARGHTLGSSVRFPVLSTALLPAE